MKRFIGKLDVGLLKFIDRFFTRTLALAYVNWRHYFVGLVYGRLAGRIHGRFGYDSTCDLYFYQYAEWDNCSDVERRYFSVLWRHALIYGRGARFRGNTLGQEYLLHAITFSAGDVVIDVGANIGDLELFFRSLGLAIEYHGYEPSESEWRSLKRNVIDPRRAYRLGCWSANGALPLFVESGTADSSFINGGLFSEIQNVSCVRLDERHSGNRVRLLKIEAEGAEPEVIAGCKYLLPDVDYVVVDAGFE